MTLYQEQWGGKLSHETVRLDPTRMAQGIMTAVVSPRTDQVHMARCSPWPDALRVS